MLVSGNGGYVRSGRGAMSWTSASQPDAIGRVRRVAAIAIDNGLPVFPKDKGEQVTAIRAVLQGAARPMNAAAPSNRSRVTAPRSAACR